MGNIDVPGQFIHTDYPVVQATRFKVIEPGLMIVSIPSLTPRSPRRIPVQGDGLLVLPRHKIAKFLISDIGRTPLPINDDLAAVVDQPRQFDADTPAVIRDTFPLRPTSR